MFNKGCFKLFGIAAVSSMLFLSAPAVQVYADEPAPAVTATTEICDQYMSPANYAVLTNVVGALESGGQIYGNRNYGAYAGPYANSPNEYTITLGWCQFYGPNAETLVQEIFMADPAAFVAIDQQGLILSKLNVDWTATRWAPTPEEKEVLIQLITSPIGQQCQDAKFLRSIKSELNSAIQRYGVTDPQALMMYVEIAHLGGRGAANRIFDRCVAAGSFDVMTILQCLFMDYNGNMQSTMVGAPMYWQRHLVAANFIMNYTQP